MFRQLTWVCLFTALKVAISDDQFPAYFDLCKGKQCSIINETFLENFDKESEPCDNFYDHSCKNDDKSTFMYHGGELEDLKEILIKSENSYLDHDNWDYENSLTVERKIYDSCLKNPDMYNSDARSQYNRWLNEHYADQISKTDGEILSHSWNWTDFDLDYAKKGFGFAFFDVDIVENFGTYGSNERYIQISPMSDDIMKINTLLSSEYINKDKSNNRDYRYNELKKFLENLNKIFHNNGDYLRTDDSGPKTLSEWQYKYINKLNYNDFQFNFTLYIDTLFKQVGFEIRDTAKVIIKNEAFFKKLSSFLGKEKSVTIEKYIHLRFVSKTIGFVEEKYKTEYSLVPPIEGLKCTPGLFFATAREYGIRYFSNETRQTAKDIYENVQKVIYHKLKNIKYNRNESFAITENFLTQLRDSELVIGYPDFLIDPRKDGKNHYLRYNILKDNFQQSKYYFLNQMKAIESLLLLKLRPYWMNQLPIFDINLIYKSFLQTRFQIPSELEQILIPIRIFSENNYKLLSAYAQEAFSYGSFGTELASRLYEEWLSRIGYTRNVSLCVQKQLPMYRNREMTGTLYLKATSYSLGLQAAFEANPHIEDSTPIVLYGYGTEPPKKFFFMSFAESICRWPIDIMELEIKKNSLNFAISNMEEFNSAFTCYLDKKYTPPTRCDLLENIIQN